MLRRKICIALLGIIFILLSACSAHSSPTTTANSTLHLPITARSTSAWAKSDQNNHVSVSASCQPGEQLLGGGFGTDDVFENAAWVTASYPSTATTWTVSGYSISTFQLSAEVYCAPASIPLGTLVVPGTGTVACPGGTVLLGGGFQGGAAFSHPQGNAWASDASQVYALCAAQHVHAGTVATSHIKIPPSPLNTDPGQRGGGSATCPAGQVATGGGFAGGSVFGSGADPSGASLSGWSISVSAGADVTVYAVCQVFV